MLPRKETVRSRETVHKRAVSADPLRLQSNEPRGTRVPGAPQGIRAPRLGIPDSTDSNGDEARS